MEQTKNEKTELENLTQEIKSLTEFLKNEKIEKEKKEQERIEKENLEKQEKEKLKKQQQEQQQQQQQEIQTEKEQTQNQFFKDIEEKKFDFEYKKIIDGEKEIILVDNTQYNNYIATKINEFTTFFYVTVFFLFVILTFNFIKNILGK